jgi:hypothetical protein
LQKQAHTITQRPSSARVDLQVTGGSEAPIRAMTVLKPFFLVACVAFVAGFAGYCALYRLRTPPVEAASAPSAAPLQSAVAEPAPSETLIPGRRI